MVFSALAALGLYSSACAAANVTQADRGAIDGVISAQIEAFKHDDGAAALRLASPGLQLQFGDGAHFLDIVREDYPAVYRPRSFVFGEAEGGDGVVIQTVEIVGPDGAPATALYEMQQQPDGIWRISGCSLVRSRQVQI
jgi:hypothetical protein